MEKEHFWYRARSRLLEHLIQRYIPRGSGKTFLEVGCGTGVLLPIFDRLGFHVTGMDINATALRYAKKQSHAKLIRSSVSSLRSHQRYDAIGTFDILEHQNDDQKLLLSCRRLLRNHGYLFITVPSHPWLWSSVDDLSGHVRRYDKHDLVQKLQKAGFSVCFSNYWNVLLLGFYILWRMQFVFGKRKNQIGSYFMIPPRLINTWCQWVLQMEEKLFFTIAFPFGSSLIIVAKKQ
jgi:SAM-dependent methyltransferase